jgi:hypothetical protein
MVWLVGDGGLSIDPSSLLEEDERIERPEMGRELSGSG